MDIFSKCYEYNKSTMVKEAGYYPYFRPIESEQDAEATVEGRKVIMLGSNNYLGLTSHPKVKEAAKRAVQKYGSGCTGSRFLNGTLDIHVELEEKLAKFLGKEAALVFSTGYQTNLGIISTLVGRKGFVFIDRDDHASIVDGCRLCMGKIIKFKHNDANDLIKRFQSLKNECEKLLVIEGVYSTQGDIADLPAMIKAANSADCRILVDDAHGIGVLGENGKGTCEHFGVLHRIDLIMITFSKSFASIGGMVAGEQKVIEYIKHNSRPFIFSASLPPASVATVLAALDVIREEPERRKNLLNNAKILRDELKSLGFVTNDGITPIIPVIIGDMEKTFIMWKELFNNGVFVNPMVAPAVPPDRSLLRLSVTATHTHTHLEKTIEIFKKVGKSMGII